MRPEEGHALLAENAVLKQLVAELQAQVAQLTDQIAELEKRQKTPSFVKANRAKKGEPG